MQQEINSTPIFPLIGKTLPDIELEAYFPIGDKLSKLKLGSFKGKWLVILFYPSNFTYVCPTELEEAAEYYNKFKKLGAEIISVSTDSAFAHKAWHDNSKAIKKIKYPMVADPTGKLCKTLGVYIEDEGISLRATYIIDPDQIIKSYDVHDNSIGRSTQEILRKLQAIQFVREHKGLVCPVSWKPGANTLKPGVELVGKL